MTKISELAEDTSLDGNEEILMVDTSAATTKQWSASSTLYRFTSRMHELNWGGNTYYQPPAPDVNAGQAYTVAVNTINLFPFYNNYRFWLTDLVISVNTAAASAVARMAIYSLNAGFTTATLAAVAPTASVDCSTTGMKAIDLEAGGTSGYVEQGLMAAAIQGSGAQFIINAARCSSDGMTQFISATPDNYPRAWRQSNTWGSSWPTSLSSIAVNGTSTTAGPDHGVFFGRQLV